VSDRGEGPGEVVLLRIRLGGQPRATLHAAGLRRAAERLAADADTGDQVEVLPASTFAVSAHVTPAEVKAGLRLLGVQRPDGSWWQPPATGEQRSGTDTPGGRAA
jgi:hypothetical protein